MIEVIFEVKKFEQLSEILRWIKEEEIEKNHPNIKIRIGVGTTNLLYSQ